MTVSEKIQSLRTIMKENGIDFYIVPTADFHQSEYVGEYFKAREFMTGFTGSAGIAVFSQDEAALWVDGRYFVQAAEQIRDTEIILQRMGEEGVPTITEYLRDKMKDGQILGFDGRVIGIDDGQEYEAVVAEKNGQIRYDKDLVDLIWTDRPELSKKPAFNLDEIYAGESVESKLTRLRKAMEEEGADKHVIANLDDIGWLLNIRGDDVEYFPLLLSYAIVTKDDFILYTDERKLNEEIMEKLEKNHVSVRAYNQVYEDVKEFGEGNTVLLDGMRTNYALYKNISDKVKLVNKDNPSILMKCVKNAVEIKNIKEAHIKDGIAHTKFMYWLKKNIGKIKITEMSASDKLEEFRAQQEHYMWPSFEPISAYKEHGAIVHYAATEETDAELKPVGLLMTDTGGHYYEGSTDITRTVALGELRQIEKDHFTTVLISNLNLADAKFLYGCNGMTLDCIAREPFWRQHLNFNHGTGHGVGYLGNIHEPPIGFRWRYLPDEIAILEPGMVITDEPGIYIEGSHGIRIENELLVCEDVKNEYGRFLKFEPITFVPIDLDAVNPDLMTDRELQLLNDYHAKVYELIGPHLDDDEREWLKEYTRPLSHK